MLSFVIPASRRVRSAGTVTLSGCSSTPIPCVMVKCVPRAVIISFNRSATKAGANHVAIYPFIDFSFTASTVPPMDKREKRKLLDDITCYCLEKGYTRNSIWTFSGEEAACSVKKPKSLASFSSKPYILSKETPKNCQNALAFTLVENTVTE